MLVLHYTGMATGEAALARLTDPAAEVSCHYLVWEGGGIDQLVAEADRAWHAGRAYWAGETDLNALSVGIEVVNGGHDFGLQPFPPAQVAAVAALADDICRRRGIPARRVLAHSDVAPDRKKDPGERFPWSELAAAGVGLWAAPPSVDAGKAGAAMREGDRGDRVRELQRLLAAVGYRCAQSGILDAETVDAATAFQRHWCPSSLGCGVDDATWASLRAIAPGVARSS